MSPREVWTRKVSSTDEPKDQHHHSSGFSDTVLRKRKREAISAPCRQALRLGRESQMSFQLLVPLRSMLTCLKGPSRKFRLQGGAPSNYSRWRPQFLHTLPSVEGRDAWIPRTLKGAEPLSPMVLNCQDGMGPSQGWGRVEHLLSLKNDIGWGCKCWGPWLPHKVPSVGL